MNSKESITLVWFDSNVDSHDHTIKIQLRLLRQINDYVVFHNELEPSSTF
jgi:hypothetical protein